MLIRNEFRINSYPIIPSTFYRTSFVFFFFYFFLFYVIGGPDLKAFQFEGDRTEESLTIVLFINNNVSQTINDI